MKEITKFIFTVVTTILLFSNSAIAATYILKIDGSSTVYPITEAVAEEFQIETGIKVTVGVSGTGGGFKKFCRGDTVISNASRPIKPNEIVTKPTIHIYLLFRSTQRIDEINTPNKIMNPPIVGVPDFSIICRLGPS